MFETISPDTICEGCSVLSKKRPFYCKKDYTNLDKADILFLSDSFKYKNGSSYCFSPDEYELIINALRIDKKTTVEFSSSIKCPNIKKYDIKTEDQHKCRLHLEKTVLAVKPKLIYTCGNLSFKMLTKKSGVTDKRGSSFPYEVKDHKCTVVPVYHPYMVLQEPKYKYLFELDIKNGYDKYILNKVDNSEFHYTTITSIDELHKYDHLRDAHHPVAIDIETTGLDFTSDIIQTISLTFDKDTVVIPYKHKDSPLKENLKKIHDWLIPILMSDRVKIFQNAKFDLKFLKRVGLPFKNCHDTAIMAKLIREEAPNGLKDLVKEFYPEFLEDL